MEKSGVRLKEYVNGEIYYGIKTGLNEAFIINRETRDKLISEDITKHEKLLNRFLQAMMCEDTKLIFGKLFDLHDTGI